MGFNFSLNFNSKAVLFHIVHISNQNFNHFHAPLSVLWDGTAENTAKGSKKPFSFKFLLETTLAADSIQLPAANRVLMTTSPDTTQWHPEMRLGNSSWLYIQRAVQVVKPQSRLHASSSERPTPSRSNRSQQRHNETYTITASSICRKRPGKDGKG